jgi:predicted dehydrogenase
MVDFHNRWNPGVTRIREGIAAGRIGAVQMVYYRLSDAISVPTTMLSWAGRSTVNWFLGSHCIDTLRWLLADEVARVHTVTGSGVLQGRGVDTPDYYLSVLEFREGAHALLENCWILPERNPALVDFKLEVVGQCGAFHFDGSPHRLLEVTDQGPTCPDTFISPTVQGRPVGFARESIRHFVDCLLTGRQPMTGFEDGRKVTQVIMAMERSASEGRPVEL